MVISSKKLRECVQLALNSHDSNCLDFGQV